MYNCIGDDMAQTVVKKWGNSYGIILPIKLIREHGLSENDVIDVRIAKKIRKIKLLFGTFKTSTPTQKIKIEMRSGWHG
jgi:hypothetical protein